MGDGIFEMKAKEKRWRGGGAAEEAGRLDQPLVGRVVSEGPWEKEERE